MSEAAPDGMGPLLRPLLGLSALSGGQEGNTEGNPWAAVLALEHGNGNYGNFRRKDFVVQASEGGPSSGQCWVDMLPVFFLNMPCPSGFTHGAPSGLLELGYPLRSLSYQTLCPQVMSMLFSLITPWQPGTSSGPSAVGCWAK